MDDVSQDCPEFLLALSVVQNFSETDAIILQTLVDKDGEDWEQKADKEYQNSMVGVKIVMTAKTSVFEDNSKVGST